MPPYMAVLGLLSRPVAYVGGLSKNFNDLLTSTREDSYTEL
jgi:hypothetical protein